METSLSLMEEFRLMVFDKEIPREITGSNRRSTKRMEDITY
jgi:hypothetical protein